MDLLQLWDDLHREHLAASGISTLLSQHALSLAKGSSDYPADIRAEMLQMLLGKSNTCSIETLTEELELMDEQISLEEQRLSALQKEEMKCDTMLAQIKEELVAKQTEHAHMKQISHDLRAQLSRLKDFVSEQLDDRPDHPERTAKLRDRIRRSISTMPAGDRGFWSHPTPIAPPADLAVPPDSPARPQPSLDAVPEYGDGAALGPAGARSPRHRGSQTSLVSGPPPYSPARTPPPPPAAASADPAHSAASPSRPVRSGSNPGSPLSPHSATRHKHARSPGPADMGEGELGDVLGARPAFAVPMRSLVICAACNTRVQPHKRIDFQHGSFHKICFRCSQCGNALSADRASSVAGKLYCADHCPRMANTHSPRAPLSPRVEQTSAGPAAQPTSPLVNPAPPLSQTPSLSEKQRKELEKKEKKSRKALERLEREQRELEARQAKKRKKIGSSEGDLVQDAAGADLPFVVRACLHELDARALNEVEIYRRSGVKSKVEALRNLLCDTPVRPDLSLIADPHEIAGCLKLYLRTLSAPVIPSSLQLDFLNAFGESDAALRVTRIRAVLAQFPAVHRNVLAALCPHLLRVARRSDINRMTAGNLAIIFAPVLMRSALVVLQDPLALAHQTAAVRFLIEQSEALFAS